MIRIAALILTAALLLSAPVARAAQPELADAWNGNEIHWRTMQSGVKESTATGKTVVLVFHASWCSACKKYRQVFKDPAVVEATRNYVMVLVDVDKEPQVNGAFAPDGTYVPRTLFITPQGDVRADLTGKTDPEHPHTIDITSPAELLSLMRRGNPDGHDSGKPVLRDHDQQATNE
jgi:protein-disulfide reductase (glutathione)